MSTLSYRQQRFIKELLADPKRCAKAAAQRSGYSAHSSKRIGFALLQNEEVRREIDRQQRDVCERLEVRAEDVVRGIVEEIERCKKSGSGAWQTSGALRGYELLGRTLGMFKDKIDVNAADNEIIAALHAGRRRAAGLPEDDGANEEQSLPGQIVDDESKKPN
jgi:hypothetical protein